MAQKRPPTFAVGQSEYTHVVVAGRPLRCLLCGGDSFWRRKVMFNTRELTFFGLDWADKQGESAACRACGYVHSFADVSLLDWSTGEGPPSAQ